MRWQDEVMNGFRVGRIPFYAIENGVVLSQMIRGTGEPSTYRQVRQAGPAPTLSWLADSYIITPDPDVYTVEPVSSNEYRSTRTVSQNLTAAPAPPAAVPSGVVNLSTVVAPSAASLTAYSYPNTVSVAGVNINLYAASRYYAPRQCVGVIIQLAAVAPDTTAGGFPANAGLIYIAHRYGGLTGQCNVLYTIRTQACELDNTTLFMPFINPNLPSLTTGPSNIAGDATFLMPYQPFYPNIETAVPGTFASTELAAPWLGGFATNAVCVSSQYGAPALRFNIELVFLDELAARSCQGRHNLFVDPGVFGAEPVGLSDGGVGYQSEGRAPVGGAISTSSCPGGKCQSVDGCPGCPGRSSVLKGGKGGALLAEADTDADPRRPSSHCDCDGPCGCA